MLSSIQSSLSRLTSNYFNPSATYQSAINAIASIGQFFKNNFVITSAVTLGGICITGLVYYLTSSSDEKTSATESGEETVELTTVSDEKMTEITLIETQSLTDEETNPRTLFKEQIITWIQTQDLTKEQSAQITTNIMECYDDTRCTTLQLSGYMLSSLPECIGNLSALTTLYLDNNQLKELPNNIDELSALEVITFQNNPFKESPDRIPDRIAKLHARRISHLCPSPGVDIFPETFRSYTRPI